MGDASGGSSSSAARQAPAGQSAAADDIHLMVEAGSGLPRPLRDRLGETTRDADLLGLAHPSEAADLRRLIRTPFTHPALHARATARLRHDDGWITTEMSARPVGGPLVHLQVTPASGDRADHDPGAGSFDLLGHLPSPVGVLGPDGRFAQANRALCRLLGYDHGELLRRWPGALAHPDEGELEAAMAAALDGPAGHTVSGRRRYLRSEGLVVTVDETRTVVPGPDGRPLTLLQAIEIDPHPPLSEVPSPDTDLATAMVEGAGCVVVVADRAGVIQRCNRAAGVAIGRSPADLVGLAVDDAFPPPPGAAGPGILVETIGSRPTTSELELPWLAGDDTVRMMAWSSSALTDHEGRIDRVVITGVDVTARHAAVSELAFRALHDPLSGLPNRTLLLERLRHALTRLERSDSGLAVLFADLDHFKEVNDTFGHDAGDRLLTVLAERLRTAVRPSDTVARFGGDEFVVLCEDLHSVGAAGEIVDRVTAAIEAPVALPGASVRVRPSIGVAFTSDPATSPTDLLRRADSAMYARKSRSRGSARNRPSETVAEVEETQVRSALASGGLLVTFQPQVALPDGHIVGLEALVRLRHPTLGLLPAASFLGVAERAGLMSRVGEHVAEEACRRALAWCGSLAVRRIVVAVNVSVAELLDGSAERALRGALAGAGVGGESLCVEVPERALLEAAAPTLVALGGLKELGVRVSIDGARAGAASLDVLRDAPVDEVKINPGSVQGLETGPSTAVSTLIDLARDRDLHTVGQGVETDRQLRILRDLGCDAAQGYFFAGPQPAEVIDRLVDPDLRFLVG